MTLVEFFLWPSAIGLIICFGYTITALFGLLASLIKHGSLDVELREIFIKFLIASIVCYVVGQGAIASSKSRHCKENYSYQYSSIEACLESYSPFHG